MLQVAEAEVSRKNRAEAHTLTLDPWPVEVPGAFTDARSDAARRALNVVVALVGLIVVSPILLLIAIAIKLSSPGPVLFRQVRVGLDRRSPMQESGNWRRKVDYGGQLFTLYKFRTMHHRTDNPQVWAQQDDPRIFPLGKFLRKYRLDELPQLFNVIKGDMNIVGPRPEQPEICLDLRKEIPRYPHRQRVLPGITGLAQINQHYDTCLEDVRRKVSYDLEYIHRQSPLEDMRIMLHTVPSVLLKKTGW